MGQNAQEIAPQWVRREWGAEAETNLGGLLGINRDEILQDIAAGLVFVFQLIAGTYAGWLLFSIKEISGELVCFVYAWAGSNTGAALVDLEKLAKAQGCCRVVIVAESAAHIRLYQKIGFSGVYCELSKNL